MRLRRSHPSGSGAPCIGCRDPRVARAEHTMAVNQAMSPAPVSGARPGGLRARLAPWCVGVWLAAAALGPPPVRADDAARLRISAAEVALVRVWLQRHPQPVVMASAAPAASDAFDAPAPLPAGWQGMIQRGARLPPSVYTSGRRLPDELLAQLPPAPKATLLMVLDGKLLRMFRPTRTVLDLAPL